MSDEEDYMSDKLLAQLTQQYETQKVESYSMKRRRQLRESERKGYMKPLAEREREEREIGLNKTIEKDNKGMHMLMKMGYK
ncbi:hypothetical protein BDB01DRAFT_730094 [Pilobolus umbonatus]|nr:hypothetical protein BDB01DRAFT_730094 [Pilobolus umbonatus]